MGWDGGERRCDESSARIGAVGHIDQKRGGDAEPRLASFHGYDQAASADSIFLRTLLTSMPRVVLSGLVIAGLLACCSKTDTSSSSPQATAEQAEAIAAERGAASGTPARDACKLLTNEEIASIQGEAPARTQLVGQADGQLSVSQCNFMLPAGPKSLAVRVVERGNGPKARDPKEVWQETFHQNQPSDPANARYARKPQKVDGVGDEAFWLGNAKSGGLHVLKGNRYIRVSVGGVDDLQAKIAKCSKLSEFVLPRLDAAD